ncbi:DUF732 domain-containing protein [Actinokineospora pegani]|uniref:DUF732 domain-containing protein n=1 Tax=Actinokineospora pegani TaxID=2654637 RepID=UPI0012EA1BC3|nr:DUF732 domain-containing protein [Actinokineospora pegani]
MRARPLVRAVVGAALLALAACGSDDGGAAEDAPRTTPPSASSTATTAPPPPSTTATTAPDVAATSTPGAPGAPGAGKATTPGVAEAPPEAPRAVPTSTTIPGYTRPLAQDPKREAYLQEIGAAGVPIGPTGDAEVLIAQGICKSLAQGAPRATMVSNVGNLGEEYTPARSEAMVAAAERHIC